MQIWKNTERSRRPLLYVSLIITAIIMLNIFSRIENWKRDLTTNQASLEFTATDELLRPPLLSMSTAAAADRIATWVETQGKWQMVSRKSVNDGVEIRLTRTTAILRFTDDIQIMLSSEGGSTRVSAESRSRIGKGDLGQNPRNLKELVSHLIQAG